MSSVSRVAVGEDLAARIAEVALAVELADPPRLFPAGAIDRADEIAVGDGVGRLLQLPEVFRQAGDRGRWIEDDLRPVQAQAARPFGKMAVVADVDADLGEPRREDRIAEIARPEVILLPEAGRHLRDVHLAKLAEVGAVGVDHGGRVVVDAGLLLFVDGQNQHDAVLLGELAKSLASSARRARARSGRTTWSAARRRNTGRRTALAGRRPARRGRRPWR